MWEVRGKGTRAYVCALVVTLNYTMFECFYGVVRTSIVYTLNGRYFWYTNFCSARACMGNIPSVIEAGVIKFEHAWLDGRRNTLACPRAAEECIPDMPSLRVYTIDVLTTP